MHPDHKHMVDYIVVETSALRDQVLKGLITEDKFTEMLFVFSIGVHLEMKHNGMTRDEILQINDEVQNEIGKLWW